jgi:predicted CXXCH cytochrome family protein
MHGLKDYYVVLFQPRTALIGLMLLVFLGIFVVSCDEVAHHDVLTFFFEGVPPLGQGQLMEDSGDFDSQELSHTRPKQPWFVHQPRKDCTLCHDKSRQRVFSSQTYLIKPIPELCYQCHADYTTSAAYVHGPVSVGRCLFCHNPHKSRIKHLLKEPEPELCYMCHNIDLVKLIPAHLVKQQFACTECHNAHTSSIKYLLNETSSLVDNAVEETESVGEGVQSQILIGPKKSEEELHGLTEAALATELESNSMFQAFWTVSKLIEKGEIKEARAYLEKFKESNSFTNEEWIKIVQVLNLMDFAASRTEGYAEKVKKQNAVAELYYLSLAFYYAGQMEKAREGLIEVLKSNSIPEAIAKTIQDDLANIDKRLTISVRKREVAELYYRSMAFYHAGQLEKAREGLVKVLKSDLVPAPMMKTIRICLTDIDNTLSRKTSVPKR